MLADHWKGIETVNRLVRYKVEQEGRVHPVSMQELSIETCQ